MVLKELFTVLTKQAMVAAQFKSSQHHVGSLTGCDSSMSVDGNSLISTHYCHALPAVMLDEKTAPFTSSLKGL